MQFAVLALVLGCSTALKVVMKKDDPVAFAAQGKPNLARAAAGSGSVVCYKDDGFGAQLHCKQAAFAVARRDGKCYLHKAFVKGGFHTKKMEADEFMAMSSDKVNVNGQACGSSVKRINHPSAAEKPSADDFYTPAVRAELRKMYWATPKPALNKECQVAFHVRRGDVSLGSNKNRYTSNEELLDAINHNFANKTVCIFSEGKEAGFGKLAKNPKVRFHLNGDPMEAFHNLVAAPEMVIAKSSFSWAAGAISSGKVYYIRKFWHAVLGEWSKTKSSASFHRSLKSEFMIEPAKEGPASDYD